MSIKSLVVSLISIVLILTGGFYLFVNKSLAPSQTPDNQGISPTTNPHEQMTNGQMNTDMEKYSLTDVAKHATEKDCWVAIDGKVYDLTTFLPEHPGGKEIIQACGKDATSLFYGQSEHYEQGAAVHIEQYQIGVTRAQL